MRPLVRAVSRALPSLGRASVLLLLSSLAAGCTEPQDRSQPGIDCSPLEAGSPYSFGLFPNPFWFSFGDDSPGAVRSTDVAAGSAIPNPPGPTDFSGLPSGIDQDRPCNAWQASELEGAPPSADPTPNLRFRASGFVQWGSGFGTALSQRGSGTPDGMLNASIPQPRDGSAWQGIAFWARSAPQKDRTVTVEIQTKQTAKPADGAVDFLEQNLYMRTCLSEMYGLPLPPQLVEEHPCDCREPAQSTGAVNARVNSDGTLTLEGSQPKPGDCGNSFRREVTVSTHWQLYLLPFDEFWQEARPNRVSDGLDSAAIYQLGMRIDLEKDVDILTSYWVFYRREGFHPKPRAADACEAPDWDISYPEPQQTGAGGEGGAPPDTSAAETECAMQGNIQL